MNIKLILIYLVLLAIAACKKEEPTTTEESTTELYLTEISSITFSDQVKVDSIGATYRYWDDDNTGPDIIIDIYELTSTYIGVSYTEVYTYTFPENASSPLTLPSNFSLNLKEGGNYVITFMDQDSFSRETLGTYNLVANQSTNGLTAGVTSSKFSDKLRFSYKIDEY